MRTYQAGGFDEASKRIYGQAGHQRVGQKAGHIRAIKRKRAKRAKGSVSTYSDYRQAQIWTDQGFEMNTNIRRFEVGKTYSVYHMLSDELDTVTVVSRNGNRVTFTDGRSGNALRSVGPDGNEETIRLGEVGPVATGGVVRVCALRNEVAG
mgnify:CR=1 FL=1